MRLSISKESFLSDLQNKQHFVKLLGQYLKEAGITVFHATSDADVLTVQKAIDSADVKDTVLVGDDTDLLVLSLHRSHPVISSTLHHNQKEMQRHAFGTSSKSKGCWVLYLQTHIVFACIFEL